MSGLMLTSKLLNVAPRSLSVLAAARKHTLPDLGYDYNALEPVISAEIMQLHHSKHHATYVNNLNVAEEKLQEATAKSKCPDLLAILVCTRLLMTIFFFFTSDDVSAMIAVQGALRFNGGGHINHSIFWKNLCPGGSGEPEGELRTLIDRDFGSFDSLKEKLTATTVAIQGSGWGWLGYDRASARLRIATCPNQVVTR